MRRALLAVLVTVAAVAVLAPARASAHGCAGMKVRAYVVAHLQVHNGLGCDDAQRRLRTWLRSGALPRRPTGWYCDRHAGGRRLCSAGNGDAPYMTFTLTHKARKVT